VVVEVERASSLETAADRLRPDIELPGALRWLRRRVKSVQRALITLRGLMPERFSGGGPPTLSAWRVQLDCDGVLLALRAIAAAYLPCLPSPLGFRPLRLPSGEHRKALQHKAGPDPPGGNG
jgi:hypothetical protein